MGEEIDCTLCRQSDRMFILFVHELSIKFSSYYRHSPMFIM